MKTFKNLAFSIVVIFTLSSFGLINNSSLLNPKTNIIQIDSLHNVQFGTKLTTSISIDPIQQKDINKQEQEEDKADISIVNQIGYVILVGLKSVLTFVLKLFTL